MFDALVIGAGPAGSVAARLLAQAGWSVALVEKAVFPRRKVCGEFISAPSMAVLESCGIAADFLSAAGPPVTRIGLYAGEATLTSKPAPAWGRALGREHLDVLLRDAAGQAGAKLFQPAEIVSMLRTSDGHRVQLRDDHAEHDITTQLVIAACGSWNIKGVFALPPATARASDLFAFKAHFRGATLPDGLMPLLAFPGGYGGMVHSDDGRTSLSCCLRRDALARARMQHGGKAAQAALAHIMATTNGVRRALAGATVDGACLSTGPIRPGIRPRYVDGVFFTGNIAGEAHPVIAEGISMAIQSSGLLAQRLIAGGRGMSDTAMACAGADYTAAWRKRFASRIHAASFFAHLAMQDELRAASLAVTRYFPGLMTWGARLSGKAAAISA
jgi:flavin-dependent dehydrogenase